MKTVRIVVISDTHVEGIHQLHPDLVAALKQADIIVHLGDYTGSKLVEDLRELGDFRGVRGNMDQDAFAARLPDTAVIEVNGKRIALIHGSGAPRGIEQRIRSSFRDVNAVLYGHSHEARNELVEGVLIFNPGSATGKFPGRRKSYGLMTVNDDLKAEIVELH
ncbi:MAG: metallophosphoesterase family protein [Dehalococcoidia bacterium]|nr:metallophosphoesterase family protein [Dehalococcoidia bacterium]